MKILKKRLSLNKRTLTNLSASQESKVMGGFTAIECFTVETCNSACPTCTPTCLYPPTNPNYSFWCIS